ncbi:MAG TPA: ABC transporter ATP-binding protein [Victivallales bacterium]|nr:ABC transporter ATP-binding protein [Victivallales bacterium]
MLKLESISKKFPNFELQNINLNIEEGEYFVLLGKSGSGKSLILELISGLQVPDKGDIKIHDNSILRKNIQRRNIGLVFQNHSLFPHMTVKANIFFAVKKCKNRDQFIKNINNVIDILKIPHLLNRYPATLSLGESQRVALARTLVTNPCCLLLDEPLSSLDTQTKTEIRSLLRKINNGYVYFGEENREKPKTILHVTHDYEEALALSSRIAVIENGVISQVGKPSDIFRHPKSQFIAKFIGIKNFYRGCIKKIDNNTSIFTVYNENDNSSGISDINFYISTPEYSGDSGCVILRSEDITLSNRFLDSSARNEFKGNVIDIEKVKTGVEVTADIGGALISALITETSLNKLEIKLYKEICLSFKAKATHFIGN